MRQNTEKTDANGNEIYLGDIVRFPQLSKYVVEIDDKTLGFIFRSVSCPQVVHTCFDDVAKMVRVVGSVHIITLGND